jgi:hypothetical protein
MTDDENYGDIPKVMEVLRDVLPSGVPLPSAMTIRRVGAAGEIGTYRFGRNIYFDLDDVRTWASRGFRRKDH